MFIKFTQIRKEIYKVALITLALCGSSVFVSALAEEIVVLSGTNNVLTRYDTSDLAASITSVTVTGLEAGDNLIDIDFRPINGELIGLGTQGNLYSLSATSGEATKLNSAPLGTTLTGTSAAIDFNPVVDRVRYVSSSGQSLRINPENGVLVSTDTTLQFAPGDPSASLTQRITGAAYSDNFTGTTSTTLYAIDSANGLLLRQGSLAGDPISPNTGTLFTVASLNKTVTGNATLDISGLTGLAYTSFYQTGSALPDLYIINLNTGELTLLGQILASGEVKAIAIPTLPGNFINLITASTLGFANVDAPQTLFRNKTITGLEAGDTLAAIDYRPSTDELYALGSQSRIYKLNTSTGVATQVGTGFTPALSGAEFGMDFNPAVDRIRIVSDTGSNFRVHPDTGAVLATDTALTYAAGDPNFGSSGQGVALAYSDTPSGTPTTAYLVDANIGVLTTLGNVGGSVSPNSGQLFTIGSLPTAVTANMGFDIALGYKSAYLNFGTTLFEIDPSNGQGFERGTTPSSVDIAAVPASTFDFATPSVTGTEPNATTPNQAVTLTVNRSRSALGTALVPYRTVNGTAGDGDFTPTVGLLTFLNGETTRTITVPVSKDVSRESAETFTVELLTPLGGVLGTQTTSVASITDSIDSDSDGFTNLVEVAAGTDPFNAASNPLGTSGPVSPRAISNQRLSLTFNLVRANRDAITFTGRIGTSSNLNLSGKKIIIEIGKYIKQFTLNSRGTASNRGASIRLNRASRNSFNFTFTVSNVNLLGILEDQGVTRETRNKTKISIPTSVVLDKRLSTKQITVTYSVAQPTRATARN